MKISTIFQDDWVGVRSNDREFECVDVSQVVDAIDRLNGKNHTLVILTLDDGTMMNIGGGNDGLYVVHVAIDIDRELFNLVDPTKSPEAVVDVVAGGQAGEYPARQAVDKDTVIRAAREFAVNGTMSSELTWESQS